MSDPAPALDELDFDIISQLQDDGRRSFTDIARELGVSVGTIRNRIHRMTESGIVRFICRPDAYRVGFHSPANVKVAVRPSSLIEECAEQISKFPEVYYLAHITGEYDLDIDVMCRDQEHLGNLVTMRLPMVPGVDSTLTNVILRVYKLSLPELSLVNPFK